MSGSRTRASETQRDVRSKSSRTSGRLAKVNVTMPGTVPRLRLGCQVQLP